MRTFSAQYYGRCGSCDERICPYDQVKYEDNELIHANCDVVSLPHERDATGNVCRQCWLVHAGDCP